LQSLSVGTDLRPTILSPSPQPSATSAYEEGRLRRLFALRVHFYYLATLLTYDGGNVLIYD
jgi:hypothetical protein